MTRSSNTPCQTKSSPAPWGYEYSPYRQGTDLGEREIPAFEVFDDHGNPVLVTNEDQPVDLQEANARLVAAAPALLEALESLSHASASLQESLPSEARLVMQPALVAATTAIRLAYDGEP